jgi:hypothetical protein
LLQKHLSLINAVQAHFMILKDSLDQKIQNGGEIQDGRQTIKLSRIVRNNANNLQLRTLKDWNI